MPEKPLTVLTYAAGASFAAAFLAWIFSPSIFRDSDGFNAFQKPGVVGLSNPANDCFINSVLQALATSDDLRRFLAEERNKRPKSRTGSEKPSTNRRPETPGSKKYERLREGVVSNALGDILDRLTEVPKNKKTISARDFIGALEYSFGTRLSRQQQDAQELLHLVVERINDEHDAAERARKDEHCEPHAHMTSQGEINVAPSSDTHSMEELAGNVNMMANSIPEQHGIGSSLTVSSTFPLEGVLESQIECQTCHFKPKSSKSTFLVLTLNVLQQSATSLDSCLDGLLKQEFIDDYKCDSCRLEYALRIKTQQFERASQDGKETLNFDIVRIKQALDNDPETPPAGVELSQNAPTSRISRHTRMTGFPKVLAVHLSRSIFDASRLSQKNDAKVSFPEDLILGGFERKDYRLRSVVTHRGGHNSGHYETFRRHIVQIQSECSSNPMILQSSGESETQDEGPSSPSRAKSSFQDPRATHKEMAKGAFEQPTMKPENAMSEIPIKTQPSKPARKHRDKKKEVENRWWRISDDKARECKTKDVLSMQKEAYLLFYERSEI